MKTKVLFLGAFLCANFAFAQTEEKMPSNTEASEAPIESVKKVADVGNDSSTRQLVGPARKNPLAGGRAGSASASFRSVAPLKTPKITGPAYKNRKPEIRTSDNDESRRATPTNAKTGPRYKNRTAKTGG